MFRRSFSSYKKKPISLRDGLVKNRRCRSGRGVIPAAGRNIAAIGRNVGRRPRVRNVWPTNGRTPQWRGCSHRGRYRCERRGRRSDAVKHGSDRERLALVVCNGFSNRLLQGWQGFGGISFLTFYKNSFIYAGFGTLFTISASAIVAYAFARIRFVGRNFGS